MDKKGLHSALSSVTALFCMPGRVPVKRERSSTLEQTKHPLWMQHPEENNVWEGELLNMYVF